MDRPEHQPDIALGQRAALGEDRRPGPAIVTPKNGADRLMRPVVCFCQLLGDRVEGEISRRTEGGSLRNNLPFDRLVHARKAGRLGELLSVVLNETLEHVLEASETFHAVREGHVVTDQPLMPIPLERLGRDAEARRHLGQRDGGSIIVIWRQVERVAELLNQRDQVPHQCFAHEHRRRTGAFRAVTGDPVADEILGVGATRLHLSHELLSGVHLATANMNRGPQQFPAQLVDRRDSESSNSGHPDLCREG